MPVSPPPGKQKQRRPAVFRVVACVLIAAIAITLAVKLLPGMIPDIGGGSAPKADRGKREEIQTVTVSAEDPVVSAAGVTVDVNELNLIDGEEKLTVERYEQKLGEDGFLGVEYDISLGDRHYLNAPLTVNLPYDAGAAIGNEVCVLHYDSDYEMWIPQDTELDTGKSTVSAKLTTLSPVRLVYFNKDYARSLYYISNKGHTSATLEVSYNYWTLIKNTPMEPALIVAQDYTANGNTSASTQWLDQMGDAAINDVNTYYTLFGALADTVYSTVNTVAASGGMIRNVTDKASKGIGVISLTIAATQLMFDLQTKDSTGPQNETAINLYKNIATNGGTLYSFCTGYSSAALSLGFFAVASTGYVLDTLVAEAKTIQAETVKTVFDTYYSSLSDFNEDDWYTTFVEAYWDAWKNGRNSEQGMNYAIKVVTDSISEYAEEFWKEVYKDGSDALTFAVAEAGKRNFYTPTAEQKKELTSRFKEDLFARFNEKVIPSINKFMLERMQDAVYRALYQTAEPYNRYHVVQIKESMPEDSEWVCKYQMCPIRFGNADGFVRTDYPEEWEMLAPQDDKEWEARIDFTLLGYIMAGTPDKVFLFDPWDEEKRFGEQIATETLTVNGEEAGYMTLIDLSSAGGAGAFTSFEAWNKEIDLDGLDPFVLYHLIEGSVRSSERIEMTHLGGNQYSFTLPAFEGVYSWNYDEAERSFSGVTLTGTMNADMTSGTFEASGSPSVTDVLHYAGNSHPSVNTIRDVSIKAAISPSSDDPETRFIDFELSYTKINYEGKEEKMDDPGLRIRIRVHSD